MTRAHRLNISKALTGRKLSEQQCKEIGLRVKGKQNYNWKGDKVGYVALHQWLVRTYGKATKCEYPGCKYPRLNSRGKMMKRPTKFQWANLGLYNRERRNWMMMCASCHRSFDFKNNYFK